MNSEPDTNALALDRTALANERTYAAWIRTGLAFLVTGLGIDRFLSDSMPFWSIRTIAVILVLFSGVAFFLAAWRYEHFHMGMTHLDIKMIPVRRKGQVLQCNNGAIHSDVLLQDLTPIVTARPDPNCDPNCAANNQR